ncbi:hypothetical protein SFOMI_3532 [Sphingobium fuliginis]|uniref:Uncharacterized protein n=1 Tax=Sphingobium fuliginis (strain ATCC 27551) TaxID=336203 RepID=A0A292ZJC5_SPHSA|nr:hypothetical protein SFOMI_3532 [Sphingobium fuliginis]
MLEGRAFIRRVRILGYVSTVLCCAFLADIRQFLGFSSSDIVL